MTPHRADKARRKYGAETACLGPVFFDRSFRPRKEPAPGIKNLAVQDRRSDCQLTISSNPADPIPPPTHIVTTAYLALRRRPSIKACPVNLAPVMP